MLEHALQILDDTIPGDLEFARQNAQLVVREANERLAMYDDS